MTCRLIDIDEVMHRAGIARATIYRMMKDGRFPRPYKIGAKSVRWRDCDVSDWIDAQKRCE